MEYNVEDFVQKISLHLKKSLLKVFKIFEWKKMKINIGPTKVVLCRDLLS
jgi:hypothetical protein